MWRLAASATIVRARTGLPQMPGMPVAGWSVRPGRKLATSRAVHVSSRCPQRSPGSHIRTRRPSMALFKVSAQAVTTIAADPKRLGARVGMTSVLHTWGSALTHHPIHMIVPGGGLSPDGTRWVACKPGFFLHVRVLSRLFRRLFIEGLLALHRAGELDFFGDLAGLSEPRRLLRISPRRKIEWVVDAPPFGGQRPYWHISAGIRTGWQSRIAA